MKSFCNLRNKVELEPNARVISSNEAGVAVRLLSVFALVLALLGLTSCGGLGSTSTAVSCTTTTNTSTSSTSTATATSTCTDPNTGISVTISPTTASVNIVSTYQVYASVSGGTNSVITWQVNGIANGNSTIGQIDSAGLYTAPTTIPSPATVNVTAVSYEDPNVSATAAITITPAPTVTISTPTSAPTVTSGLANTVNFAASENGGTTDIIIWEVGPAGGLGIAGGNSTVGTISGNGVYTAPRTPPIGQTVVVTALAQDYPTSFATLPVTISGYSKSSLEGQYAFTIAGSNASGPFFRAGSFTADGNGGLNSGLEDVNDSLGVTSVPISFAGTYALGGDGRGTLIFSDNRATTPAAFDFVLVNANQMQIIGFDGSGTSSGQANLQDPTKFNAGLSGTYVFDFKGMQGASTVSEVGEFTVDGAGNITSGLMDIDSGGTITAAVPITRGTYSVPVNPNGRGTSTLVTSSGTFDFSFYMVSQGTAKFVGIDTPLQLSGTVTQQAPNAAFGQSSLNGNYAFLLAGSAPGGAIATAGSFLADGKGHITSGVLDENNNGVSAAGLPFLPNGAYAGVYTIASNGRGTATFATATRTYTLVFYMGPGGASSMAELQEIDSGIASDGVFIQQQTTPFTLASVQGNYAISTSGVSGASGQDISGQFSANGAGALASGAIDINTGGNLTPGEPVAGTYTAPAANGRATFVLNPSADNRNFAGYVVSSTQVFVLGIDAGRLGVGALFRQF
jgi:hypothetical protein